MYKDRNGIRVRAGAIVASAIVIHPGTLRGFNFETMICRKRGRELVLDGVYGWTRLRDCKPDQIVVLNADSDLTTISTDFAKEFRHSM